MAAEIDRPRTSAGPDWGSFNEAAANGRGNRAAPPPHRVVRDCFNEAAANGRGNRAPACPPRRSARGCFNEAAANGRGNRRAAIRTAVDLHRLQ